jgi:hypothetical protein
MFKGILEIHVPHVYQLENDIFCEQNEKKMDRLELTISSVKPVSFHKS